MEASTWLTWAWFWLRRALAWSKAAWAVLQIAVRDHLGFVELAAPIQLPLGFLQVDLAHLHVGPGALQFGLPV